MPIYHQTVITFDELETLESEPDGTVRVVFGRGHELIVEGGVFAQMLAVWERREN